MLANDSQENAQIASRLDEVGQMLRLSGANPFRVRAYERAARIVAELDQPLHIYLEGNGHEKLRALPGIGEHLARAIETLVRTGRLPMLERMRDGMPAHSILSTIPGIGAARARRIAGELGVRSLEELEAAAHDGSLSRVKGLGKKTLAGIIASLEARLGRIRHGEPAGAERLPDVADILDVDREYRDAARAGTLPVVAPRRFNPRHEAWLPVLRTGRGSVNYTVLFSNTARAHTLAKTRDWVVVYFDDGSGERQCTVVTARSGPLAGRRIVRSREADCMEYYTQLVKAS